MTSCHICDRLAGEDNYFKPQTTSRVSLKVFSTSRQSSVEELKKLSRIILIHVIKGRNTQDSGLLNKYIILYILYIIYLYVNTLTYIYFFNITNLFSQQLNKNIFSAWVIALLKGSHQSKKQVASNPLPPAIPSPSLITFPPLFEDTFIFYPLCKNHSFVIDAWEGCRKRERWGVRK